MNERVQQILDGDLPRSTASESELADLAQAEALIGGVLRSIPIHPIPDLGPSVLHRIDALSAAPARQRNVVLTNARVLLAWLWAPHTIAFHWRPAYALALGLFLLIPLLRDTAAPSTMTATHQVLVQFRLDAPDAHGVALAGNFTDWKPEYQLTRTAGGVWTVTVPLAQGVHNYAFVVDGKTWQADPLAPSVADGFGGENSQIAVLTPDVSAET